MDRIKNTIHTVLNLRNGRGRLIQRDDCTLLLVDCDYLPHSAMQLIADQHPQLHIETHQLEQSTTGYVVMFTICACTNVFKSTVCMQLCVTFLFVLVVSTVPFLDCWHMAFEL